MHAHGGQSFSNTWIQEGKIPMRESKIPWCPPPPSNTQKLQHAYICKTNFASNSVAAKQIMLYIPVGLEAQRKTLLIQIFHRRTPGFSWGGEAELNSSENKHCNI